MASSPEILDPRNGTALDPYSDTPVVGQSVRSALAIVPLALGFTIAIMKVLTLGLIWALPVYMISGTALLLMFTTISMIFDDDDV